LFPFAVTETLPDAVADVAPLLFVATLVVPVLRYDLWAIDSIIRRSSAAMFESPASVVQSMVKAAGEMLHLPYVAVRRTDRVLASYGEPNTVVEVWPLGDEFDPDGELVASPRHGFVAFDETDRRVLHTVAQLVGGAVRAELLTVDLQAARQHLVTAREEERRRLRRDLHDGLGPLLTGLGLNLDAATVQLGRSDSKTSEYLGNAKHASAQVITSIRELVDGLRPPALDELGLAGALKLQIERLATDAGLDFDLQVPHDLSLPAAVEVAAFRTAVEAVTNVARHSDARRVDVALVEEPGRLVLTVTDDGSGQSPWPPGTGLVGMRERAEELGGTLTAGPGPVGGRIHVAYPLGTRP
jgi:signal transduction histidine kinase